MKIAIVDPDALRTDMTTRGITLRTALERALRPVTGAAGAVDPETEADHRALREQLAGSGELVLTEGLMSKALALLQAGGTERDDTRGRTPAERQAARHALVLAEQLADPHSPHVCLTVG